MTTILTQPIPQKPSKRSKATRQAGMPYWMSLRELNRARAHNAPQAALEVAYALAAMNPADPFTRF